MLVHKYSRREKAGAIFIKIFSPITIDLLGDIWLMAAGHGLRAVNGAGTIHLCNVASP